MAAPLSGQLTLGLLGLLSLLLGAWLRRRPAQEAK